MATASEAPDSEHWQRNLWVCVFGSFTTLVAMTLLLPFLPLYVQQLGVNAPAAMRAGRASPMVPPSSMRP